jgi:hypothetical protein
MQRLHSNFRHIFILLAIASFLLSSFLVFTPKAQAATGINRQINFQGRLVNNTTGLNLANSSYSVVFSFYNLSSGGTALWSETQSVTTTDGIFRVALGSITPFPANFNFNWDGLYLGIKVGTDSEMSPRIQMAAVPFAFNAQQVAGLTVLDSTNSTASTSATLKIGTSIGNPITVDLGQNAITFNSGVYNGSTSLTINTANGSATSITLPSSGTLLTNTSSANQTATSTQVNGNVFSIADTAGTGTLAGISFNLNGSGTTYDLLGTGSTWSITNAGVLTVASCTGCGGGPGGGPSLWQQLIGALSPVTTGDDLLLGGTTTASADFAFTGLMGNQTQASFSGQFVVAPNVGFGGNASIAGTLTLGSYGLPGVIQTTSNQLLTIGGNTTGDIQFMPGNSSSSLYLSSNGTVRIGSANVQPSVTLDVSENTNAGARIRVENTNNGALARASLIFGNDFDTMSNEISLNSSGNTTTDSGLAKSLNIWMNDAAPIAFGTSSTTRMLITATGQFGIGTGTTTPVAQLQVNGQYGSNAAFVVNNSNSGDLIAASASGATKFRIDNSGNASMSGSLTMVGANSIQTTSNTLLTIGGNSTGNILLSPNNTSTLTVGPNLLTLTGAENLSGNLGFTGASPSITNTGTNTLTINSGSTGNIQFFSSSNTLTNGGALTLASTVTSTGVILGTNPASAGIVRIPNANWINARNAANNADINMIEVDASNNLDFYSTSNYLTSAGALTLASTLSSGSYTLTGTNPTISATSTNTLTLNSGVTGNVQFFSTSNYITSGGALTLAGTVSTGGNVAFTGSSPSITNTGTNTLTINSGSTGNIQFFSSSNTLSSGGALSLAGNVGIGVTSNTAYNLLIQPTNFNTAATLYGLYVNPQFGTSVTTAQYGGYIKTTTAAAGGGTTLANQYGLYIDNPTPGTNWTYTNNYGLYIANQTAGGTNNYAIYSNGGFNYFGGNVGIGTSVTSGVTLSVKSPNATTTVLNVEDNNGNGRDLLGVASGNGTMSLNNSSGITMINLNASSGTTPMASISGATTFAALVVDQSGLGDVFTASASGNPLARITNYGQFDLVGGQSADIDTLTNTTLKIGTNRATTITLGRNGQGIVLPGFAGSNAVLYANGTGTLAVATTTTATQCLTSSGGGNPGWASCAASGGAGNYWTLDNVNGTMYPINTTLNFLWGGTSSSSATFNLTGNSGSGGVAPVASISGHTSYAALVVDNTVGNLIAASSSGQTDFVVRQNGSVGIGAGTSGISSGYTLDVLGNARIGSSNTSGDDILKQTTSDFTQAGSTITTSDSTNTVSTANNQLALVTDMITAGGSLTAPANGAGTIQTNVGAGAVAFQRPDGKFLVVPAGGVAGTLLYDSSNGQDKFSTGPNLPYAAGAGTNAFQRADGKFIILIGGTNQTAIYTATGSSTLIGMMNVGASISAGFNGVPTGVGSQVIKRSDGKFLIIAGGGTSNTSIYDPTVWVMPNPPSLGASDSGSFTPGPSVPGNVTTGSFSFETIYGKWIVGIGGSSTTYIYDPSLGQFSTGPSLAGGATTGAGAHVIQRPDNTFLLILGGGSTGTQVYNPTTNAWTNSGTPTLAYAASTGSHSFQLSNGKWITVAGGGASVQTSLYDPNNGTYGAYSDPGSSYYLYTGNNAGAGALTFQRPDGKYVILSGNGAKAYTIFDGGWNTAGTWTSEAITSAKISTYSAIMWTGYTPLIPYDDLVNQPSVSIAVKTAATSGLLSSAQWVSIGNSGDLLGAITNPPGAIQIQVTFNAPIVSTAQQVTSYINQSNVWGGESFTFNRRTPLQPAIYTLRVSDPLVQYGGLTSDPAYGRNFATAGATLEGVVTSTSNQLTLAPNRDLPTATTEAGFFLASASADLPFSTSLGAGAFTIQLPNGNFLIVPGHSLTTTAIYNSNNGTYSAGPPTPSAAAAGAHAFELPNGQFFVVLGGNTKNTAIYDPVSNTFYSGPLLANAANTGATTFQRPDGLFVIISGTTITTNLYDPFLNQVTAGPALTGGVAGAGTITIKRPDGRVTVMLGGTLVGNTYDADTNTFAAGPNMTAGTLVAGSTAVQLATGRWLVIASTTTNQTLDPVTSTFTVGPTKTFTVAAGSFIIPRPDGKVMLAQGGTTATQIYDPDIGATNVTGSFYPVTSSPNLPCAPGAGANVFQRPDGMYVVLCGGNTNSVFTVDAGWNLSGNYTSEEIFVPNLSAQSSLFWQNAGNQGTINVIYRTASSQTALGVAAWKQMKASGSQLSITNGDQWLQTSFSFTGAMPANSAALQNVWLSTDTGMVTYYKTVAAPVLSYWKLMNSTTPTILTLTSNGNNAFRFTADGQAYTSAGGAWNSGGADLAENYTSSQQLLPGEVVIGDKLNPENVIESTDPYQTNIMGVVSTDPGFVAGAYTPDSYPIALVGRVPVQVSTENGPIHAGDYLTSASIPGYAMKATTAGRVLGTALEDFNPNDPTQVQPCPANGAGSLSTTQCGTITVFVNLADYNGESVELAMADDNFTASPSGLDQAELDTGLTSYTKLLSTDDQNILAYLESIKEQGGAVLNSEIFTGRLSAANEVITPNLIADMITARTIKADHIEGLEVFTDQLSALSSQMAVLADATQSGEFATPSAMFNLANLNVNGLATISADLNVGGNSIIQGALDVLDNITTKNLLVSQFAYFINDVVFKGNVRFNSTPTFNSDTAGFAVIKQGQDSVQINFSQGYVNTPVVTASIALAKTGDSVTQANLENQILNGNLSYVITQRTTDGFAIRLNKPAPEDINFSWVALSVQDAKTAGLDVTPTIAPTATDSAAFQSIVNQLNVTPTPTQ